MLCPKCHADGVSFWRVWLFNLRQKALCSECATVFLIRSPDPVAFGTIAVLLMSGASFLLPGGRAMGLILLLMGIVVNFVLTHHFVSLEDPSDGDE